MVNRSAVLMCPQRVNYNDLQLMSRQANVANDNKYHTLKGFIDDEGYPWNAPRNF